MPIYEYRCENCKYEFEELIFPDEPPIEDCPKCTKKEVRQLISTPSFSLKGGGWYSEHYGLKSKAETSPSEMSSETSKPETSKPESPKPESPKSESPKSEVSGSK